MRLPLRGMEAFCLDPDGGAVCTTLCMYGVPVNCSFKTADFMLCDSHLYFKKKKQ